MSRGVNDQVAEDSKFAEFVVSSLKRHTRCDWGDCSEADKQANDLSLVEGSRLLSAYEFSSGKIWIITEADRSSTTVLFPDEY